jgi:hypothetical protein
VSSNLNCHHQHPVIFLRPLPCSEDPHDFVIPNIIVVMNPATSGLSSNHAPPSGANASVPPSASLAAHSWIAELMEGMIPEMAQASNASASAMDPNNTGVYQLRTTFLLRQNNLL